MLWSRVTVNVLANFLFPEAAERWASNKHIYVRRIRCHDTFKCRIKMHVALYFSFSFLFFFNYRSKNTNGQEWRDRSDGARTCQVPVTELIDGQRPSLVTLEIIASTRGSCVPLWEALNLSTAHPLPATQRPHPTPPPRPTPNQPLKNI